MTQQKHEQLNIAGKDLVPIMKEQINAGKTVCFNPKGISMLPLIRQGRDSVTLKKIDRPLKKHDIAFYQRDNGQFVLHRIVKLGETVTCIGDNQFVYETGLRRDQFFALVCEFSRDGKKYSVDYLPYRIYYHFWYVSRPFRHFATRAINKLKRIIKGIIKKV